MNVDLLPGLGAAAELTLETPFLENFRNYRAGERSLPNAIKIADSSAHQFLRREALSASIKRGMQTTTGDDSMKVSVEREIR